MVYHRPDRCRVTLGPLSCALGPREDRPGPLRARIAVLDGLGKSPRHALSREKKSEVLNKWYSIYIMSKKQSGRQEQVKTLQKLGNQPLEMCTLFIVIQSTDILKL